MTDTIYTSLGYEALVGGLLIDNLGHDLSQSTFMVLVTNSGLVPPSAGDAGWVVPTVSTQGANVSQRTLQLLITSTSPVGDGTWYLWAKVVDSEKIPEVLAGPFVTA